MTAPQMCACRGHTFLSLCPLDEVRHVGHHRLVRPPEIGSGTTSSTPNKTDTPSRSGKPRSRRRVRWENIWVKEAFAIAVIVVALVSGFVNLIWPQLGIRVWPRLMGRRSVFWLAGVGG